MPCNSPDISVLLIHSSLRTVTDVEELQRVLLWFEVLAKHHLSEEVAWSCKLILTEAFTNAVRHAHAGLPRSTPIQVDFRRFDGWVELRVWDGGPAFDLAEVLKALKETQGDDSQATDPLGKESGRGLIFMHRLSDDLRYERGWHGKQHRNCLVACKQLHQESKDEAGES